MHDVNTFLLEVKNWITPQVYIYCYFLISSTFLSAIFLFLFSFFKLKINKISKKTNLPFHWMLVFADVIVRKTYRLFFVLVSLYLALQFIDLPIWINRMSAPIIILLGILQVGVWCHEFLLEWQKYFVATLAHNEKSKLTTVFLMFFLAKFILWCIVVLFILKNFGVNITTLLAGFGIGGIAVALGVQKILNDILASVSILLDKPFVIGDNITVGNESGIVEKIGLKTTRLKSNCGEQLIFSNSDLLNSRIRNFKRMLERRVTLEFGIAFSTPLELLPQVPDILAHIVNAQSSVHFDRAHIKAITDTSIRAELVYTVSNPDNMLHLDVQQKILLRIIEEFHKKGVELYDAGKNKIVTKDDHSKNISSYGTSSDPVQLQNA